MTINSDQFYSNGFSTTFLAPKKKAVFWEGREIVLFQENPGWWNVIIWPDQIWMVKLQTILIGTWLLRFVFSPLNSGHWKSILVVILQRVFFNFRLETWGKCFPSWLTVDGKSPVDRQSTPFRYNVQGFLHPQNVPDSINSITLCYVCFFPKICVYFSKQQLRRDIQFRTWWRCCGSHRLVDLLFYLFICGPCILFLERVAQVRLGGPWT